MSYIYRPMKFIFHNPVKNNVLNKFNNKNDVIGLRCHKLRRNIQREKKIGQPYTNINRQRDGIMIKLLCG